MLARERIVITIAAGEQGRILESGGGGSYDLAGAAERLPNFLPTEKPSSDRASVHDSDAQTA
jgi:hypothetical protein